jgi:hypothetical protein
MTVKWEADTTILSVYASRNEELGPAYHYGNKLDVSVPAHPVNYCLVNDS